MKMEKGKGGLLAEYLRCHGGDLKDEAKKHRKEEKGDVKRKWELKRYRGVDIKSEWRKWKQTAKAKANQ